MKETNFLTANYLVRVDRMGDASFRYAVWEKTKKTIDVPDLVLYNGVYNEDGKHFVFKNDTKYTYELYPDNPWQAYGYGNLIVYDPSGKEILRQQSILKDFQ